MPTPSDFSQLKNNIPFPYLSHQGGWAHVSPCHIPSLKSSSTRHHPPETSLPPHQNLALYQTCSTQFPSQINNKWIDNSCGPSIIPHSTPLVIASWPEQIPPPIPSIKQNSTHTTILFQFNIFSHDCSELLQFALPVTIFQIINSITRNGVVGTFRNYKLMFTFHPYLSLFSHQRLLQFMFLLILMDTSSPYQQISILALKPKKGFCNEPN